VIYYPAVLLMISLSKNGTVNPAWAVWVGNVILACVSASLLRRVIRH
jgi:lipopolysaccharide export LptBFGC system permease protein LptF